jgi:hypothetical protein
MFMPLHAEKILHFSKMDAASTVSAYGLANMVLVFFCNFTISRGLLIIYYFPNFLRKIFPYFPIFLVLDLLLNSGIY